MHVSVTVDQVKDHLESESDFQLSIGIWIELICIEFISHLPTGFHVEWLEEELGELHSHTTGILLCTQKHIIASLIVTNFACLFPDM